MEATQLATQPHRPDEPPLPPLLIRPKDLAQQLAVSRSRAYELIASGQIPSLRIGRSVRVRREDLDLWVREQLRASEFRR